MMADDQTMIKLLPTGRDILPPYWPDAEWGLTGLFGFDELFWDLANYLRERFECAPKMKRLYANLPLPWNGEDFPQFTAASPQVIPQVIADLNRRGIGVFITFANHKLTEAGLAEPNANNLMRALDNGAALNGVALASDALDAHIRKQHPGLKRVASVVRVTADGRKGDSDYYRALCESFDLVQLHPDDAYDETLLDTLDRNRIEVTVNDNFEPNTDTRQAYYDIILQAGILGPNASPEQRQGIARSLFQSAARPYETLGAGQRLNNLTSLELKRVYDMGFRLLRLKCEFPSPLLRYDVIRYLVEPEMICPAIFKLSAGKLSATKKPSQQAIEPPKGPDGKD